jgi:single-strand DNA-binding protein
MMNTPPNTICGRLGKDPTLNETSKVVDVTNFSVADNEYKWDSDANRSVNTNTTWFKCVAWDDVARAFVRTTKKGDPMVLVGKWRNNAWTDKNGVDRLDTEFHVMTFCKQEPQKKRSSGDTTE